MSHLTRAVFTAMATIIATVANLSCTFASPTTQVAKPVVVELFTSEGCSDCPEADRLLAKLVKLQPYGGIHIIGLEEHVDYWNNKHWGDPFSAALFTNRQYAYSDHFNDNSVYTPEMVVDGDAHFVGSDNDSAAEAICMAANEPTADLSVVQCVTESTDNLTITVSDLPKTSQENISLVVGLTEDSIRSHVADGENAGKTLDHGSVVRELVTVGMVNANDNVQTFHTSIPMSSDWRSHPLSIVAFLQSQTNLKIYGSSIIRI